MIGRENPLIFMHIPKTGGMSLFASMCEHYGLRMADLYNLSAEHRNLEEIERILLAPDNSVFAGHFPFGLHEWLEKPTVYVSIVRNPVDRIVSLYHYALRYRRGFRQHCQSHACSFQSLFDDRIAPDFFADFLPWIAGSSAMGEFLACQSPELDNGMVRRFSGLGLEPGRCPDAALDTAKRNIEHCVSVVGLQERYDETLLALRLALGINLTAFHINRGRRPASNVLNPVMKKRIEAANQLDIALYAWLEERFDQQLRDRAPAVGVPGGRRRDVENLGLWRAIGHSPLRESARALSPAVAR